MAITKRRFATSVCGNTSLELNLLLEGPTH